MRRGRDVFNELLIRWHRWTADPKLSTDSQMREFDSLVGVIRPVYRVALILEARNLACGATVWSSVRAGNRGDRDRARSALMRLLGQDQEKWFGAQLVQYNARGNRIGESNPMAGLTDHEVDLLREMRDEKKEDGTPRYSLGWLALRFKIPKSTVSDICSGRRRGQAPAKVRAV